MTSAVTSFLVILGSHLASAALVPTQTGIAALLHVYGWPFVVGIVAGLIRRPSRAGALGIACGILVSYVVLFVGRRFYGPSEGEVVNSLVHVGIVALFPLFGYYLASRLHLLPSGRAADLSG